jgi:hypothetical protein
VSHCGKRVDRISPGTIQICFFTLIAVAAFAFAGEPAQAQKGIANLQGMWSDPPHTAEGWFCFGWCTDAGLEYLNKLLDDPSNDVRPFPELAAAAAKYQRELYIRPRLTEAALKTFPLDPATDPSFTKCEPYGAGQQIFARHQLEIRARGADRIEMRYGEWDALRTVYLTTTSKGAAAGEPTLLGHSVGHWEDETLVIETSGISARRIFGHDGAEHSNQLRIIERYARAKDGKTLTLTATLEDPWALKQPVVLKKIWGWSPNSRIAPYKDCERPVEPSKGVGQR